MLKAVRLKAAGKMMNWFSIRFLAICGNYITLMGTETMVRGYVSFVGLESVLHEQWAFC